MRYKRIEDGEKIIYCTDKCKLYVTNREQEYHVLDEIEKEECYCAPEKKAGSEKEPARLKKLIILMTSACNLRCRYCYLNYGKYDGGERTCNIKVEDAQKAIDIIFEKYPEGIGFIQFFWRGAISCI